MDKEQFEKLAMELEATLFHVSYSILRNEQDCADAVQEAVMKAYAKRDSLRQREYFKTWLVRIVINECYAILRRNKRQVPVDEDGFMDLDGGQTGDDHPGNYVREEYLDLYRAIERLEERERLCVLLFYMEDYTIAQVARTLQVPEGTVKSRLNRAREHLKGFLE